MSPEHESSNVASWRAVAADIELSPDTSDWQPWKALARRFLRSGSEMGLCRYFRAGRAMHHIIFSTLDHHGLRGEPRVTIELHPPSGLRIAYGTSNLEFQRPELEYSLGFEEGSATFRRFLHQLWAATVPEPIPEDIRGPASPLSAPVLP